MRQLLILALSSAITLSLTCVGAQGMPMEACDGEPPPEIVTFTQPLLPEQVAVELERRGLKQHPLDRVSSRQVTVTEVILDPSEKRGQGPFGLGIIPAHQGSSGVEGMNIVRSEVP